MGLKDGALFVFAWPGESGRKLRPSQNPPLLTLVTAHVRGLQAATSPQGAIENCSMCHAPRLPSRPSGVRLALCAQGGPQPGWLTQFRGLVPPLAASAPDNLLTCPELMHLRTQPWTEQAYPRVSQPQFDNCLHSRVLHYLRNGSR